MPAYKDQKQGTWYCAFYYENWQGERKKKLRRGFETKKEALEWERQYLLMQAANLSMEFGQFYEIYAEDKKKRVRENTWESKEHIFRTKILPYFGKKKLNEIHVKDVIAWQNMLLEYRDEKGKPYSPVYLKTIHNQLSAIFNHAVRYYGLIGENVEIVDQVVIGDGGEACLLVFSGTALDVQICSVSFADSFAVDQQLFYCGELSDCALQMALLFPGDLPSTMLRWRDSEGEHEYLVMLSGEDGHIFLSEHL